MEVLITGATGIIGKKLIESIRPFGHSISVFVREKERERIQYSSVRMVTGNLLDTSGIDKATENIHTIIHLAGITHTNNIKLYYSINTKGTKNLLESCEKNGVKRFIYISSRTASADGGAYAHSKLLAEEEVKKSRLDWVILRPAEVYGAGGKDAIAKLVKTIRKGKFIPIVGNGSYLLCPVHIEDVIYAIIKAIEKPQSIRKTYVIGGPDEYSLDEIVDIISKQLNIYKIKVYIPVFIVQMLAYIFSLCKKDFIVRDQVPRLLCKKSADINPARKDFGFSPMPFTRGIKTIL